MVYSPFPKKNQRIDGQIGAGNNVSGDDRMGDDEVASSPILLPTTPGDDSPYELINYSFDDSMFATPDDNFTSPDDVIMDSPGSSAMDSPVNSSDDVNMDSPVNSPGDVPYPAH